MKKWFYFLLIAAAVMTGVVIGERVNVKAAASLAISKKNFPDKNIRKVLSKNFDKNKDRILSKDELKAIKKLRIDATNIEPYKINFKGISKLKYVKILWAETEKIKNLTELRKMPKLEKLHLWTMYNDDIDISKNVNLKELKVEMPLDEIKLSHNKKLKKIWILNTKIKKMEIKGLPHLKYLYLPLGKYKYVTVKKCSRLKQINMESDKLTDVAFQKLSHLEIIKIEGAEKIKNFKIPVLPRLKKFKIDTDGNLRTLEIPFLPKLETLTIKRNQIKYFNFKKVPNLKNLYVFGAKKATEIDLRPLKKLEYITWNRGVLKKIRFGKKKKLYGIELMHNKLSGTWKLSRFPNLYDFYCDHNRIKAIYAGKQKKDHIDISCRYNNMKKLDVTAAKKKVGIMDFKGNPHIKAYLYCKPREDMDFIHDKTAKIYYKVKR